MSGGRLRSEKRACNRQVCRKPQTIAHFQLPIVLQGGAGRRYCQPMTALYLQDNWQLEMGNGQFFWIMDFDPLFW
jgi:hypothetical protein